MKSNRAKLSAALISVAGGLLICGLKFAGYVVSDSAAIFSDAVESINNIVAAMFSAYAIWQSSHAPDQKHPFGKGRLEYFSAGFEGALIVLAAIFILYASIPKIIGGQTLHRLDEGLVLLVGASVLNLGLGWFLVRRGRRLHSDALVADGKHVLSDVVTSAGVVGGLLLVYFTDLAILDPILAVIMALWIFGSGVRILKQSFDRLMDRVRPEALAATAEAFQAVRRPEMILPHQLRLRETGPRLELHFHMIVPRYYTIEELHELESKVVAGLQRELRRPLFATWHSDPCSGEHCNFCSMPVCPVRAEEQTTCMLWRGDTLTLDEGSFQGLDPTED